MNNSSQNTPPKFYRKATSTDSITPLHKLANTSLLCILAETQTSQSLFMNKLEMNPHFQELIPFWD